MALLDLRDKAEGDDSPSALRSPQFDRCIRIWPFQDAPEGYQALSDHRGDEDWVVLIPKTVTTPWFWADADTYTELWGWKQKVVRPEGTVLIFAH